MMRGYGRVRHTAACSQLLCPEPCCIGHRGVGDVEEVVGMKKAAVSGCVVEEEVGGGHFTAPKGMETDPE